jgi:hypothetical protein
MALVVQLLFLEQQTMVQMELVHKVQELEEEVVPRVAEGLLELHNWDLASLQQDLNLRVEMEGVLVEVVVAVGVEDIMVVEVEEAAAGVAAVLM